ncbi:MAG TPA: ABC transporter ATP-binding protein [Candidatus Limnocylindria bacterium]
MTEANGTVVRTRGLTKSYGTKRGIVEVDLEVHAGEIFGYLGPNGSGKSTTIRLLLDLIRPTHGTAEVLGHDAHNAPLDLKRQIGFLPGEMALYERMTGRDMLRYFAYLRGMSDLGDADTLAERLEADLSRPIRSLSRGNKQKVGIVQALMHRPALAILDEPSTGLDPLVQQEFYRILREVRTDGRTVFLSSHVLAEVEHTADRVAILRHGHPVVISGLAELKAQALRKIELYFSAPVSPQEFSRLPSVRGVRAENSMLELVIEGMVDDIIKVASRYRVENVISREQDLEEVFLTYYHDGTDEAATPPTRVAAGVAGEGV